MGAEWVLIGHNGISVNSPSIQEKRAALNKERKTGSSALPVKDRQHRLLCKEVNSISSSILVSIFQAA
jgi:hypothetical protein